MLVSFMLSLLKSLLLILSLPLLLGGEQLTKLVRILVLASGVTLLWLALVPSLRRLAVLHFPKDGFRLILLSALGR